ncbi:hypothetical protein K443DRAFT_95339 [Laccaria amethystina LaAM-08-1]|uniref:DUF202 domain-containing protein n=1 Tax=Laccaria amethystina LaAM-08-1 TaxID=1095629 RepID=A0A0C9Y006_9AGAR|nr:hypothetical protein K443DRAFT_95339 [Laccaria amethystina LaAM-08-1]
MDLHQPPHQPIESTPLIAGHRKATRKRTSTARPGLHQSRPRPHSFQYLDKGSPCTYPSGAQQSESSPLLPHFSTGTSLLYTDTHSSRGGAWQNSNQLDSQKPAPCGSSHTTPSSRSRFPLYLLQGISLRLENSGSVARDHLASERTFLAYMRTSLAITSSGIALIQLFSATAPLSHGVKVLGSSHRLHLYIRPLGASTISFGLLVLFIGVARYFTIQAALTKGYFPVARLATGFIAIALTVLVTLTVAILLAGKLEPR